jgi:two-component sensor histidine kinase
MSQPAPPAARLPKVALRRRLTTRVLLFLTLAMVPLGIIGVHQNQRLNTEVVRGSELSLLALTGRSASGEREVIQRTFGTAQSLSEIIDWVRAEPGRCTGYLNGVKGTDARFAFVGFIEPDLSVTCSTAGRALDLTQELDPAGLAAMADLMANPRESIEVNPLGPVSGQSVMILNYPRFLGAAFQGYVTISLPLDAVGGSVDFLGNAGPILTSLAQGRSRTFIDTSADGQRLAYAAVPLVPDVIYALGVWPADMLVRNTPWTPVANAVMPLVMWLASLSVAWFAIDRFVVSRINNLAGAMRDFSHHRRLPTDLDLSDVSSEMADLEQSFRRLAEDVLHEEAEQENRLREKSVLLKEVHHRVKNNLQIISSIMNMQIRKASAPETKRALAQVQDRIMGLSGVHRTLYQAENLTQVNAATLIERIIEQSQAIGSRNGVAVRFDLALDPVTVFPDQAVPLSMLVSEAVTNAMKYVDSAEPLIRVRLSVSADRHARLCIENRIAPAPSTESTEETGLGRQLIRAFAAQLNGTLTVSDGDGRYLLDLAFEVEPFKDHPPED